jgi:hypothetical protein
MVLPHVISQREDSAPWTTTICQTMHRVAIAPITDHTPTKNARNVRCDVTGRPARCWMWCAGSHDLTSPLRTRASHRFHHNLNLSPQRTSPPGSAGVAPACRVHRHCARIQRYTPSPLHRLGARASSPHAGCTGIAPAYSDTPHHPCTAWGRRRLARMPGARASRPRTAMRHHGNVGITPSTALREWGPLKGRFLGRDGRFSAFPCAFAPHPSAPLLPHGEKGEFGRPEAQNEKRNAGASKKPTPVSFPRPLLPS